MVVEGDLFAVRVCLGGVVLLHKVTVHELEGQGGLAHAARPDHDDLVQWQLLFCLLSHLFKFWFGYTKKKKMCGGGVLLKLMCCFITQEKTRNKNEKEKRGLAQQK